jgi:hypothetical protein
LGLGFGFENFPKIRVRLHLWKVHNMYPKFGVRIQILLDSIYDVVGYHIYAIQQDLNSNTKFGLNSGLKFRAFSTRGVTGNYNFSCINIIKYISVFPTPFQFIDPTVTHPFQFKFSGFFYVISPSLSLFHANFYVCVSSESKINQEVCLSNF